MLTTPGKGFFRQILLLSLALALAACQAQAAAMPPVDVTQPAEAAGEQVIDSSGALPVAAPTSERPVYAPGELVDYTAQTGDTLPALAVRFNTTIQEIRQANPGIPDTATTMPPGMPMKIPIYYTPFWGSSYLILSDSLFVNGPAQIGFNTQDFLAGQPGWLKNHVEFAFGANRSAADIIDLIALQYSVSPRLLLALLEYQSGAVSNATPTEQELSYPMGYRSLRYKGLYQQVSWVANLLNNGYYGYRASDLTNLERDDGRLMRFDPWLNAATASLQNFFNLLLPDARSDQAISPQGFASIYQQLFGDPQTQDTPHIPGSLEQPALILPFEPGSTWAFTGGPHNPWGSGEPLAAIDFAPPLMDSGCLPSSERATAIADGVVVRSDTGEIVLDLDGDGDERTGWDIYYLHLATVGRVQVGTLLKTGDPVGYPSCEGGSSTGTHVHMARKYNGEWILAEGVLAFNLEGWIAHNGKQAYEGTLTRNAQVVTACTCSNQASFIKSDRR